MGGFERASSAGGGGVTDHGALTGLADDDHEQYLLRDEWLKNGFVDRSLSVVTMTDLTRTLAIAPTGASFTYFHDGVLYTSTGASVVIDDTEGIHYVYFDGATLTAFANPTAAEESALIRLMTLVAIIYWDADNGLSLYVGEERHGYKMAGDTHNYLHFTRGLQYETGLALVDFATDQNGDDEEDAQFGVDAGAVADEDIFHAIAAVASTTGLPLYYRSGASAWRKVVNAGFPLTTTGGVGEDRPAYNQFTGGLWQLTEIGNGNFLLVHVFATTEKDAPLIAVLGQDDYGSLGAARTGAETELRSLLLEQLPLPEIRPLGTVIYQGNDSYGNSVKARTRTVDAGGDEYVDWRSEVIERVTVSTSDHGALSGLADDDHTQYFKTLGVQEGGANVVTGERDMLLNFDADDFVIGDGGGGEATIALASGIGVSLLVDGSNAMRLGEEVNFAGVSVVRTRKNALESGDLEDPFDDGSLQTSLWDALNNEAAQMSVSEVAGSPAGLKFTRNASGSGAGSYVKSLYQLVGNFDIQIDVVSLLYTGVVDGGTSQLIWAGIGVMATDETTAQDLYDLVAVGNATSWTRVDVDAALLMTGISYASAGPNFYQIIVARTVEAGSQTGANLTHTAAVTDSTPAWAPPYTLRITRTGTTIEYFYDIGAGFVSLGTRTWNSANCNVILPGSHAASTGDFVAPNNSIWLADFLVTTGVSAAATAEGPIFQVESLGDALADEEVVHEIYAGPKSASANIRLRTVTKPSAGVNLQLGTGQECIVKADLAETAGETMKIGVPEASRRLVLCDAGDLDTDTTLGAANHPVLSIFDAGLTEALSLFHNGTDAIIAAATDIALNNTSLGDVTFFQSVSALANNRKIQLFGHDDSVKHTAEIFHDGDWLWFANLTAAGQGIIFRSEPGTWRFQTGSTVHASLVSTANADVVLGLGTPTQHGFLKLLARTTATTAAPFIALERQGNDGTFLNLAAGDNYRLYVYENVDPADLSTTPAGYVPVIKTKATDFSVGELLEGIDIGLVTGAGAEELQVNIGGAIFAVALTAV